jgi:small subunit ribosomal protein S9
MKGKTKKGTKKVIGKKEGKKEVIFTVGKRKRAVARCLTKPGSGVVLVNSKPLEHMKNEVLRLRIFEPLAISGDSWKSYDFMVNVKGGGVSGQAEASRQAIARGLVKIFGSELREKMMGYDRNLLVYDPRRTEPHKPPRSSQGPRRYKQRSKR